MQMYTVIFSNMM